MIKKIQLKQLNKFPQKVLSNFSSFFLLFSFDFFFGNVFKIVSNNRKATKKNKSFMKNYEIFHLIKSYKLTEYNFITSLVLSNFPPNSHYSRFHRNALEWKTFIFCFLLFALESVNDDLSFFFCCCWLGCLLLLYFVLWVSK